MTKKEFRKSVSQACKSVMKKKGLRYVDIEINYKLPYVAVGNEFFDQGDGADYLIEQAQRTSEATNLAVSTCLVWFLDSAGIFN